MFTLSKSIAERRLFMHEFYKLAARTGWKVNKKSAGADDDDDPARIEAMADILGGLFGDDASKYADYQDQYFANDPTTNAQYMKKKHVKEKPTSGPAVHWVGEAIENGGIDAMHKLHGIMIGKPTKSFRLSKSFASRAFVKSEGQPVNGIITTKDGRRVRYVNGKPVKLHDTHEGTEHHDDKHFDTSERPGYTRGHDPKDHRIGTIQVPKKTSQWDIKNAHGMVFKNASDADAPKAGFDAIEGYHRNLAEQFDDHLMDVFGAVESGKMTAEQAAEHIGQVAAELGKHLDHSAKESARFVHSFHGDEGEHGSDKANDIQERVRAAIEDDDDSIVNLADRAADVFITMRDDEATHEHDLSDYESELDDIREALKSEPGYVRNRLEEVLSDLDTERDEAHEEKQSSHHDAGNDLADTLNETEGKYAQAAMARKFNKKADTEGLEGRVDYDEDSGEWSYEDGADEDWELHERATPGKKSSPRWALSKSFAEFRIAQHLGIVTKAFTGVITDKRGRKIRYANGKRVAMNAAEPTAAKQSAPKQPKPPTPKQQAAAAKKEVSTHQKQSTAAQKAHAAAQKKHDSHAKKHATAHGKHETAVAKLAAVQEAHGKARTEKQKATASKRLLAAQAAHAKTKLERDAAARLLKAHKAALAMAQHHAETAAKAHADVVAKHGANQPAQAPKVEDKPKDPPRPQENPPEQKPAATKPKPPAQAARALAEKLIGMSGNTPIGDSRSGARLGPASVLENAFGNEKFAGKLDVYGIGYALQENRIIEDSIGSGGRSAYFNVTSPEALKEVIHAAKTGKYQGEDVETSDDLYDVARRAMARHKKR